MRLATIAALPFAFAALSACDSAAEEESDRVENRAEASAAQAGAEEAVLGMTEAQLLDAELVAADGTDLGDVEAVRRNAAGEVENLLIEIEDSDPDRYVLVPVAGLTPMQRGDDRDLSSTMTRADLTAMPDAPLEVR